VATKVKTPSAGKNMVGEAFQALTMDRLCKLNYFLVQGLCLVLNSINCNNYGNFSIQKFYMRIRLLNPILSVTHLKNFMNEIIEPTMLLNKVKEIQE
jgi:hypothetical protein